MQVALSTADIEMGKTQHNGLIKRCRKCHEPFEKQKWENTDCCELCRLKIINKGKRHGLQLSTH